MTTTSSCRRKRRRRGWPSSLFLLLGLLLLLVLFAPAARALEPNDDHDDDEATSLLLLDDEDDPLAPAPSPSEVLATPRRAEDEALLIVPTIDGRVHAVGSAGEIVWSFDSGAPLVTSYQGYENSNETDDDSSTSGASSAPFPVLIPAVDGSLLVHTPGKGVQRLPLKAAQLVDRAPFLAADGRTLYTGARTSEALMVDLDTGAVVQRFSGPSADKIAHMIDPRLHTQPPRDDEAPTATPSTAPTVASSSSKKTKRQLLWVGRVEHSLRAVDTATGQELWNLTVSELTPLFPSGGNGASSTPFLREDGEGSSPSSSSNSGTGSWTTTKLLSMGPGKGRRTPTTTTKTPALDADHRRALTPTQAAVLDVLGPGPGWGGAGALLATPEGGLHRRDPSTGKIKLLAPLGAAPVNAFVVAPGGEPVRAGMGGGGGGGTMVPLLHTLMPPSRRTDDEEDDSSSSSTDEEEQEAWFPPSTSPTVSIGQLPNGRLFGIVLEPTSSPGAWAGGGTWETSALPHYLQNRNALPSPSSAPTSLPPTLPSSSSPSSSSSSSQPPPLGASSRPSLPRIPHPSDCPAGYPSSLCSLRKGGGKRGRPSSSSQQPPLVLGGDAPEEEEEEDDDDEWGPQWDVSCRPGDEHFPACLLGVHHLLALEAPPASSSSSSSSQDASGSGNLLGLPWPRLLDGGRGNDGDASSSSSEWARRDILWLATLILAAVMVAVMSSAQQQQLFPWLGGKAWAPPPSSALSSASARQPQVVEMEGGALQVGRLVVAMEEVLGYGCHGTIVYKGLLDGRPVAVKRMLRAFHAAADREMRLLIESDGHPNVVRYFLREQAGEFVYLALELCVCSLRDVIVKMEGWLHALDGDKGVEEDNDDEGWDGGGETTNGQQQRPRRQKRQRPPTFVGRLRKGQENGINPSAAPAQVRGALHQIALGVVHLHSLRIVHRDLKPHNILLAFSSSSSSASAAAAVEGGASLEELEHLAGYVCKISDMGVGKLLALGQSSFGASSFSAGVFPNLPLGAGAARGGQANNGSSFSSSSSNSRERGDPSSVPHGPGSVGWQAPEVMSSRLASSSAGPATSNTTLPSSPLDEEPSPAASAPSASSSRRTQAVDVFSLGCVFYTVLVPGTHPFGEWYERERNILQVRSVWGGERKRAVVSITHPPTQPTNRANTT